MALDRGTHGCKECQHHHPDALVQVGKSERNTYFEGKAWETITRFACRSCGAKWTLVQESGLSKGTFWNPEVSPSEE